MPNWPPSLKTFVIGKSNIGVPDECHPGPWKEPALGSHVVTSRRFYLHHGIYAGGGCFIHYAGFTSGLHRGPVEEVSIERFSGGRAVWIRSDGPPRVDGLEVVQRARSRLGENSYKLLSNNCIHFCKWCLNGEKRSPETATGYLTAVSQLASFLLHTAKTLVTARIGRLSCLFAIPGEISAGR
jgi:lecithin:retinol acyltransferase